MPQQKGHYTACVCVLFDQPVEIDDVIGALRNFDLVGRAQDPDPESWMFSGPSLAIAHRPDVNGLVVVDAVNHPWPARMGDPVNEKDLFGAWMLGHLGPFTFPDCLSRASKQSWVWPGGKDVFEKQTAFVRIRAGYAFGEGAEEKPLLPEGYNATEELRFLTNVAGALLEMPGALCYFNPGGEVLRDSATLDDALRHADMEGIPPLDVWSNVRLAHAENGWVVMDTVGNLQLDIPDIELGMLREKGYDLTEVDGFLRNVTEYLLANGDVIKDGDTMDGLGTTWVFHPRKSGILMPPRPTIRAFPQDGTEPPAELLLERQN